MARDKGRKSPTWNDRFEELKAYKAKYGHCNVPVWSGPLGKWILTQRRYYKKSTLSDNRIKLLEDIGFMWSVYDTKWDANFEKLKAYKAKNGHCNVPGGSGPLGDWVNYQRKAKKDGKLSADRIKLLKGIGFVWKVRDYIETRSNDQIAEKNARDLKKDGGGGKKKTSTKSKPQLPSFTYETQLVDGQLKVMMVSSPDNDTPLSSLSSKEDSLFASGYERMVGDQTERTNDIIAAAKGKDGKIASIEALASVCNHLNNAHSGKVRTSDSGKKRAVDTALQSSSNKKTKTLSSTQQSGVSTQDASKVSGKTSKTNSSSTKSVKLDVKGKASSKASSMSSKKSIGVVEGEESEETALVLVESAKVEEEEPTEAIEETTKDEEEEKSFMGVILEAAVNVFGSWGR